MQELYLDGVPALDSPVGKLGWVVTVNQAWLQCRAGTCRKRRNFSSTTKFERL